ncbi:hypothetical protein DYB35_011077 [Aphanomyces astaci]|uniref:Uncharacterized protein n=1 Tax=Aphanomyces astaci TaxID=112090 RepID=A0A418D9J6_APHAT|nr:hypothetical protein DYB35_011077 [Aphanomyces astaci]
MGIIWMSVSVDYGGEWRSCLAIPITSNVWCDGIRTEFGINQYYHWMTELPILDGRIAHPVQCLFCGDLERLHHFKDCPDIDQDGIDQIKWTWKGYDVGEQPVYADVAANLRIPLSTAAGPVNLPGVQQCYVISRSDSLLVSHYALQSIGIDMNHLLEQVAQHQSHEDGDDVGEPDEDEDIAFGVATRLQGGEQDLDKLDEDAAVSQLEKAFETLKITATGKHVKTHKLKDIVMQASAKGVWRAQFRGTDQAANVPAMDIKLKADAQPHRCKARKMLATFAVETCLEDASEEQQEPWNDMVETNVTAEAVMEATAAEAVSEAEAENATGVVTVAAAKVEDRPRSNAYEVRLEDECRRKNIQFREHVTSYVACFSDKQLLRTMMTKLQDIAKMPMNDVDPDLESLFDDIEFNMREEDATMRAADYMTACWERIDMCGAGEFLRTPDIRKRMYTSLLNQLPGKVSEYTKDAFKKKWHPVDFEWGDLIQIVVDLSVEQQTYWMRWGAGAGKRSGTKSPKHKKSKHGHDYQNRGEDKKAADAIAATGVSTVVDVKRVVGTTEAVDEARKVTTAGVNDMEVVDAQESAIKARTVEAITPVTEAVPKTPSLVGPETTKA